ncbi:MAG: hypothetical protein HQ526_01295, partial [Actinobacteria bacterium]|nr:hypothetical protein [Actinomycetota bacterium]
MPSNHPGPPGDSREPDGSTAEEGWRALASRCIRERRGTALIVVEGGQTDAHLWPTSQVIAAALARAVVHATGTAGTPPPVGPESDAADLDAGLERFELADVYT